MSRSKKLCGEMDGQRDEDCTKQSSEDFWLPSESRTEIRGQRRAAVEQVKMGSTLWKGRASKN